MIQVNILASKHTHLMCNICHYQAENCLKDFGNQVITGKKFPFLGSILLPYGIHETHCFLLVGRIGGQRLQQSFSPQKQLKCQESEVLAENLQDLLDSLPLSKIYLGFCAISRVRGEEGVLNLSLNSHSLSLLPYNCLQKSGPNVWVDGKCCFATEFL